VTDRGRDDVLCVLATTRSFPADASIEGGGALAGAVEPGPGAEGGR
jgi:hypothetical protein